PDSTHSWPHLSPTGSLPSHVTLLQRFRFCGDLDCPDWVLAEISTLAKISSVKLRLLCSQVLKELLGQGIDYEKILKLTADAKFESGDVKATVAVLSFILSSAAKHSVDSDSLSSELQQLGLPKEHATSLCRCYEEKQSPLQEHLRACSLRGECALDGACTSQTPLLLGKPEPQLHTEQLRGLDLAEDLMTMARAFFSLRFMVYSLMPVLQRAWLGGQELCRSHNLEGL
uniref:COMM domain containing 4 n=1 Tax=Mus spicilegus TaxID=10103 RepID=A0A8C6MT38_MUSSI